MANEKNLTEVEYFAAHGSQLGFPEPLSGGRKFYDFNMNAAQLKLQTGEFMSEIIHHLSSFAETYAGGRPYLLYYPAKPSDLSVLIKPYSSVLTKIFRINYLNNRKFPEKPVDGDFVTYKNIYDHPKMNDLLRGRLICKYMDAPKIVMKGLEEFCKIKGFEFKSYPMNNDMGYYAWHCYIRISSDIMIDNDVKDTNIWFEIQITTQLAEVITELTHGLYEGNRVRTGIDSEWRWQPKSQQFRSAYLGHTLHLLEGIIQTFRDEVLGLDGDSAGDIVTQSASGVEAEIGEILADAISEVTLAPDSTNTSKIDSKEVKK